MSTPGAYTFLPWVRQGIAAVELPADPGTVTLPGMADFNIHVHLNAAPPIPRSARLYGPADVIGIDAKQIVRVDPSPYARGVEPNYLAMIEFDRPDFPWLFTPASANSSGQLRPWLALIVVKQQDGVELKSAGDRTIIEIRPPANAADELMDLKRSWAWAHAQLSGEVSSAEGFEQVIQQSPERASSRLICPRRLQANEMYHACLVPAFEVGLKAALELPIQPAELIALAPAWNIENVAQTTVRLPVFYHWQFTTGPSGDFESLAKRIKARPIPDTVGARLLDTSSSGEEMPSAPAGSADALLPLGGALVPLSFQHTQWTGTFVDPFQTALRNLIDPPPTPNEDPLLGPPRYADIHAKQTKLPDEGQPPNWFRELNLDPRNRVTAGFGVAVVQQEQEALMAAAWQQAGEIERANGLLRHAQLAQLAADSAFRRHLSNLDDGALIELTRPIHVRLIAPESLILSEQRITIGAAVARTRTPAATTTSAFRRVARPRGPVFRRIPLAERNARRIVERISTVNTQFVALQLPEPILATVTNIEERFKANGGTRSADTPAVNWLAMFNLSISDFPPRPSFRIRRPEIFGPDDVIGPLGDIFTPVAGDLTESGNLVLTSLVADNETAKRFREAVKAHQRLLSARLRIMTAPGPQLKVEDVGQTLLSGINPRLNMAAAVHRLINVRTNAAEDELEPISMSLDFRRPMYKPLCKLSQDLFLPGVAGIPEDTAMVLRTNRAFVEAYMAGLNHEMGRELLWRNYPAQPGVTCFRDFWDSRSRIPRPPANMRDIPRIDEWKPENSLGANSPDGADSELVLLIKGELLQRYPTAIVSAIKASWPQNQPRPSLSEEERFPVFHGQLEPDIAYFGFQFSETEALGDVTNHEIDPGWFFVISQRPGEPRFGVDVDVPASPEVPAGPNAGATALQLLRRPKRTAIHAFSLLRPRNNA